jgi:Tol biopolymer transport system component
MSLACLSLPLLRAQARPDASDYLGQSPPGLQPQVFAPGLISTTDQYEFGSVFNKSGIAFYYAVETGGPAEIRYTERVNGEWTPPKTILSHPDYGMNDPFLSPDEKRLYFISQKNTEGSGAKRDYDIWYVEREEGGWSEPINAGPSINSDRDEYYISFTRDGAMYFASNRMDDTAGPESFDIFSSTYLDGTLQQARRLGQAINTPHYEADVFIAPDESYVIFCAIRPEGSGRGDLYVSFRGEDGDWTPSVSLGNTINTPGHELCPFVSHDGKYLFYTSNEDIYWVSTEILEKVKEK